MHAKIRLTINCLDSLALPCHQVAYALLFCLAILPTLLGANDELYVDDTLENNTKQASLGETEIAADVATPLAPDDSLVERLAYIQSVLTKKIVERRAIGDLISTANEQDRIDYRRKADELSSEINQLRGTIEKIAIGSVDTSLFSSNIQHEKGNWRTDVALIAQPVIDSLKEITEKPRRIKELNELIKLKTEEKSLSDTALLNLQSMFAKNESRELGTTLINLQYKWNKRKEDAISQIDIANIQLISLQGGESLSTAIYSSVINFAKGRGLTIVMAFAAAATVWWVVALMMRGYRHSLLDKRRASSRTRYRLARYSVQALRIVLILIAVFVVFYERHDVLLLGLLILFLVGFALSAKHLLPRYIQEARLLLNLGAIREGERVIINGLPWRVESINMSSIFKNPELSGALRLPLASLSKLVSRPFGNESWFPTSTGDVVLIEGDHLLEVLEQNPDTVELRKKGGEIMTMPAADFYSTRMTNLSRSGTFGVTDFFGIDYQLQTISHTKVPEKLTKSIQAALSKTDLAEYLVDVQVELQEAGVSSINYWLFVTMKSASATSYYRVHRIVQTACINTCSQEKWGIPYPHLSVVNKFAANEGQMGQNHTGNNLLAG